MIFVLQCWHALDVVKSRRICSSPIPSCFGPHHLRFIILSRAEVSLILVMVDRYQ